MSVLKRAGHHCRVRENTSISIYGLETGLFYNNLYSIALHKFQYIHYTNPIHDGWSYTFP